MQEIIRLLGPGADIDAAATVDHIVRDLMYMYRQPLQAFGVTFDTVSTNIIWNP